MSLLSKNRKTIQEDNHDRYLLTYADLITLLLGLFVILYASAQVDEKKYKEFSKAFSKVFTTSQLNGVLDGSKGVLPNGKGTLEEKTNIATISSPFPNNAKLPEIKQKTDELLKTYIQDGRIEIRLTGKELILSLPENLLFESSKAELKKGSFMVLDTITKVIKYLNNKISIDGHTDIDAIKTFQFESNWHLSTQRALNVGYRMLQNGLPETNVQMRGFGAQRPIASNNTVEGKSKNRRVEISISELTNEDPNVEGYK
jgi:chemotaxis protein MotB